MELKKRAAEEDFIYTLSDDEGPVEEEEVPKQPPKKKAKTSKKRKQDLSDEDDAEDEDTRGVWGQNDDDDGAMDPDFVFDAGFADEMDDAELEGWGFEGAKDGPGVAKRGADLDEIIRRRRDKKEKESTNGDAPTEEPVDMEMDDDDDEVLADDAFGMNADSEEEDVGEKEEATEEQEEGENDDEAASDNDSVATPVDHPDDNVSDMSDDDAEEEAKRQAFFADGEKVKPNKTPGSSSFLSMSLSRPILRGIANAGFNKPTPIQAKTVPIALLAKDLVVSAPTGSGKTAAFLVPILERWLYRPNRAPTTRVVILLPTRELAMQCHAVALKLAKNLDIRFALAVGGLSLKKQEMELRSRPDIVIGTPGRFIDHMRNSAGFNIDSVEVLVLDEADRMLEDGFADELNEILTTMPKSRQTMLFSATMNSTVDSLIRAGLSKPVRLQVDAQKKTVGTLVQEFLRLRPNRVDKRLGYLVHLCKMIFTERVIVFFRQKKDAHKARIIFGLLGISCAELHGSMNQTQRIESVEAFRDGKVSHLLATDLASRGLDIKGVDTVINYEGPQTLDTYVHRVGRTARAGRTGVALTLAAEADRKVVKAAIKAGKAQGAKIVSRTVDPAEADKWQDKIDEMEGEIEEIMIEEKEERQLAQVEMQVRKGENLIEHEAEIKSRPKRTWFESEHDKKKAKEALKKDSVTRLREAMKDVSGGKLSNKARKRLDSKQEQVDGKVWQAGKKDKEDARSKSMKKGKGGKGAGSGGGGGGKGKATAKVKSKSQGKAKGKGRRNFGFGFSRTRRLPTAPKQQQQHLRPPSHPHPHHLQGFLRYLFPHVRDRYRERLIKFHLDTVPYLKHSLQSGVYRYLLERQHRKATKGRLVDVVARHGRRLLLGPAAQRLRQQSLGKGREKDKDVSAARSRNTSSGLSRVSRVPASGGGATRSAMYPYSNGGTEDPTQGERGYRRKKLAAMAGSLYRSGQLAVTEMRESYAQTRPGGTDRGFDGHDSMHIPGAFPDAAITVKGGDHLVLFPSYAKRHVKRDWSHGSAHQSQNPQGGVRDEDYWRQEWEKNEDERAIVDVDVRGWIYSPHVGPMTRRNRILIGLARQLSGITAPRTDTAYGGGPTAAEPPPTSMHRHEEIREQEKIAAEAARIERQGQEEKRVAYRGGYSENQRDDVDPDGENTSAYRKSRRGSQTPDSAPGSPSLPARSNTMSSQMEMSEAELAIANANLMARIAPFMTNPIVALPITMFFYNDTNSQSRTVLTNDAGHFIMRAALDFVPTHVRVLANEGLSSTQEVKIIEPRGVSLISDIDDTIKRSNISSGAREIFRNTFVKDLGDLTVDGVKEWYGHMHSLGVSIHYCSNSPWQLFPVLASFFKQQGLPPGSLHLKQYSGMLQGIFEPVAERKKGTLHRLMRDFPDRKFLLVGDSGEADLEVYTELALSHPDRILAIFIRDVTTPEVASYFDSAFDPVRRKTASLNLDDGRRGSSGSSIRQNSAPGSPVLGRKPVGPAMGTLIDFSEEPEEMKIDDAALLTRVKSSSSTNASASGLLAARKPPPPRPAKPSALKGKPSSSNLSEGAEGSVGLGIEKEKTRSRSPSPAPPLPRRLGQQHPLSQIQNSSQQTVGSSSSGPNVKSPLDDREKERELQREKEREAAAGKPPPPPPRRRLTPASIKSLSPRLFGQGRMTSSNSDIDFDPLPPAAAPIPNQGTSYARSGTRSGGTTPTGSPTMGAQGANRKLELWRRRLARAHEQLDQHGIALYTWRKGQDVVEEAVGIVSQALKDMERDVERDRAEWREKERASSKGPAPPPPPARRLRKEPVKT